MLESTFQLLDQLLENCLKAPSRISSWTSFESTFQLLESTFCEHTCSFPCCAQFHVAYCVCDTFSLIAVYKTLTSCVYCCSLKFPELFQFHTIANKSCSLLLAVTAQCSQRKGVGSEGSVAVRLPTSRQGSELPRLKGRIADCSKGHRLVHHHSVVAKHESRQAAENEIKDVD